MKHRTLGELLVGAMAAVVLFAVAGWAYGAEDEDSGIEVTKTVVWDDDNPSNATVRVWSYVPSATTEKLAANVLFLGTMCCSHTLTSETVTNALNAIASKANVDWCLFSRDVDEKFKDYNYSGSITKGERLPETMRETARGTGALE